jgi:hypothetical protein
MSMALNTYFPQRGPQRLLRAECVAPLKSPAWALHKGRLHKIRVSAPKNRSPEVLPCGNPERIMRYLMRYRRSANGCWCF